MLPYALVLPLWFLVAVVWPSIQSLHALQSKSSERDLWLFYWTCYVGASRLLYYCEWLMYTPFWVISSYVDIYYETQLLVMFYLVSPRTLGILKIRKALASTARLAMSNLILGKLQAALNAKIPARGLIQIEDETDKPGFYSIINPAAVTSTFQPAEKTIVRQLNVGEVVNVLAVVRDDEGNRVRARIESPQGWISLSNTLSGKCWAIPCDGAGLEQTCHLQDGVLAAAAVVGVDPAVLLRGASSGAEEAWEAMAMLESQLARADDFSEEAGVRQASQMLRQMLAVLTQGGNPAMLAMAKTMVPDIGKIWANESTREYLSGLLSSSSSCITGSTGSSSSSSTSVRVPSSS